MTPWRKIKELFARSDAPPSAQRGKGQEKRVAIRKPQRLVQGFIWSEAMAFPKECSIRNLSITGARIDLCHDAVKAHTLLGPLILYLPADKREIDCQVVWRAGRSIGLRFSGAHRSPTRRYGA